MSYQTESVLEFDPARLTLYEAARVTGLTPSFLRQAIVAGRLAGDKVASGWCIQRDALQRFVSLR